MSAAEKTLLVLMSLESQGAYVLVPHEMEILFHEGSTIGEDREALFSFSIAGDVVPMRIENLSAYCLFRGI